MNPVSLQIAKGGSFAPTSWGAFGPRWLWVTPQAIESPASPDSPSSPDSPASPMSPASPASPVSPASPGEFLPDVACSVILLPVECEIET